MVETHNDIDLPARAVTASSERRERRRWNYTPPPSGVGRVLLLTEGGTEIVGRWKPQGFLGWAPIPQRDMQAEDALRRERSSK